MFTVLTTWWCYTWMIIKSPALRERGSVTMENVIWALAVIAIAGVVIVAITSYVTTRANELLG